MELTLSTHEIDRLARRRAGAKLGFFVHAAVFLAVNLVLSTAAFASGRSWAIYPALGWSIGLLVHGVVVYVLAGDVFGRLVEREKQKLQARRDPW
jgi:hypothetical protein